MPRPERWWARRVLLDRVARGRVEPADCEKGSTGQLRVGCRVPRSSRCTRVDHAISDRVCGFAGHAAQQTPRRHAFDAHVHVDSIHQRPSDPRLVPIHHRRRTSARLLGIAEEAAWTGIRSSNERDPRGEPDAPIRADQDHVPVLERLTQRLKRCRPELRHLVEEEHAVVSQTDLPWPWRASSSNEPGDRARMMWCSKRSGAGERRRIVQARNRMNESGAESLFGGKRRQDTSQSPREHRLS